MRVGIMGGTFDPVHLGHLQIAGAVRDALRLEKVLLLPAGDPPHKRNRAGKLDRMQMTRLAAEEAGFEACDAEVRREGTTYTVDTLRQFHWERPEDEWVYITGADALGILDKWWEFEQVVKLCSFAVVRRPGSPEAWERARVEKLRAKFGARIEMVDAEGPEISSTEIRERVAQGQSIAGMVPAAVEAYIRRRGLYLCAVSEEELLERLKGQITQKRYAHTLGVAETAERLAGRFGIEPARARLAGLLHDCAKSESMQRMREMIEEAGVETDAVEWESEFVLHAPAGAARARLEYGVRDGEILSAIRWHTLGGAQMGALEALIYVADCIEPGRKPYPGIELSRKLAETDIFAAARACAEQSVRYVRERGGVPHPRTLEMLEETK